MYSIVIIRLIKKVYRSCIRWYLSYRIYDPSGYVYIYIYIYSLPFKNKHRSCKRNCQSDSLSSLKCVTSELPDMYLWTPFSVWFCGILIRLLLNNRFILVYSLLITLLSTKYVNRMCFHTSKSCFHLCTYISYAFCVLFYRLSTTRSFDGLSGVGGGFASD